MRMIVKKLARATFLVNRLCDPNVFGRRRCTLALYKKLGSIRSKFKAAEWHE
jgi:hypothetical protein